MLFVTLNSYDVFVCAFLKVQVLVQDGGFPPRQATCTVQISVATDSSTLTFNLPSYTETITENRAVDDNIIPTSASPSVSFFVCLGCCFLWLTFILLYFYLDGI